MKNNHKKPAMALILIIIIITSVTVVIMGTLKILTAASGNYSVNRNAKGFVKIDKPLGRYICYKYKNELYQLMVNYDSDGNIIEENNNSELRPVTKCQFNITPEMNGLNVTLIGGGAGGGVSYFSGANFEIDDKYGDVNDVQKKGVNILNYFYPDNNEEYNIENDNNIELSVKYIIHANQTYESDPYSIKPKTNCNDTIDNCLKNDFFDADKKVCRNQNQYNPKIKIFFDSCPNNPNEADPEKKYTELTLNNILTKEYKVILKFYGETIEGRGVEAKNSIADLSSLLSNAFSAIAICPYKEKFLYKASSLAPAGNVEKFSILKADLQNRENKFFTICDSDSSCDGVIGNGGSFEKAGEQTTFKYTTYLSNGGIEEKSYTTNISEAVNSKTIQVNPTDDNTFSEPGNEPKIDISRDFKFPDIHKLYSGYVDNRDPTNIMIFPATLFGSSGAVYNIDNKNICETTVSRNKSNYEGTKADIERSDSSVNACKKSNGVIPCSYNIDDTIKANLQGAPGAIIIEW